MFRYSSHFSATGTERAGMVATNPCYQYIVTSHISSPSVFKMMINLTTPRLSDGAKRRGGQIRTLFERCPILSSEFYPHTLVFARGVPSRKCMDYLDSINYHPHAGVYYAIIPYLQREYEQYYPGEFWSDFGWQFHQNAVIK
jgi:hypothetical protein